MLHPSIIVVFLYKQVIVIREDLGLSVGKTAAQASHACHEAAKKANKKVLKQWEDLGQKKVVLAAKDLKELKELKRNADKLKIPNCLIADGGYTEVKKGTITALGIGPDKEDTINKVTGHLKLLK